MADKWIRMTRLKGSGIHSFRGVKIEKSPDICIQFKKMYKFANSMYKYALIFKNCEK